LPLRQTRRPGDRPRPRARRSPPGRSDPQGVAADDAAQGLEVLVAHHAGGFEQDHLGVE
jgi:hypothetical protein